MDEMSAFLLLWLGRISIKLLTIRVEAILDMGFIT